MTSSLVSSKREDWARRVGMGLAFLASVSAAGAGIGAFLSGPSRFVLADLGAFGSLSFGLDPLSGFFALLIGIVGMASSVFSWSYLSEYAGKYSLARYSFLFNLFLMSMLLVVASQNGLGFLIFWEAMALSSYFLVVFEHQRADVADAGFAYLLVTHAATFALISLFLAFASGAQGSFDFSAFGAANFLPGLRDAIFALALIAFGAKAGIIPLHLWLPQAHPRAPSPVSALMSGVMLKVALYGFIRVLFDFLNVSSLGSPVWWGWLLLGLGFVSSVLGALYAFAENDLKRLLAYSSIENVGLLFLGLGTSVLFYSSGLPALGALALLATLFHAVSHALFKGLLFLGAGSVLFSTHAKELDKLGGLVHRMPVLSVLFFIGAASMAAIPPLSGFAGEWLLFQSLLGGVTHASATVWLPAALGVLFLALTATLAFASSVKLFGIAFLGATRSEAAAHAREPPASQLLAAGFLAAGCILLGVFPGVAFGALYTTLSSLGATDFTSVKVAAGDMPTPALFVLLLAGLLSAFILARLFAGRKTTASRIGPTWDCGVPETESRMQYTPMGFSMPLLRALAWPFNPVNKTESAGPHVFDTLLYTPLTKAFLLVAPLSRKLQTGKLVHYLLYLLLTLVGVLVYALV